MAFEKVVVEAQTYATTEAGLINHELNFQYNDDQWQAWGRWRYPGSQDDVAAEPATVPELHWKAAEGGVAARRSRHGGVQHRLQNWHWLLQSHLVAL